MVEPFGCVVMLHWRLHVYGSSVPLSATPTGPSSLFYSPLSSMFIPSLALILPFSSPLLPYIYWPVYTVRPSTNGRQFVETECYHWPIRHYRYSPLFGNYIILTGMASVTTTHTCFFIFHADIVRRYDRRLLKRLRQRSECTAIERLSLVDPMVPSRSKVTIGIGFSTVRPLLRECEIF